MKIIVTGGCGFIGSHLIKKLIKNKNNIVLNLDALSYASMPESLNKIKYLKNYHFTKINLSNEKKIFNIIKSFQPNRIFHLAAESHVDNSIINSKNFIKSNIIGTYNLLNAVNSNISKKKDFKFIHVSTDEVFGSIKNKYLESFNENSKFYPNSPYSASKASSDLLVRAWSKTYSIPSIITNCVNNFGQWQFPEKLIPVVIHSCLKKIPIPVYGKGKNIREWIYVNNHVDYLIKLSKKGQLGETYNIGSGYEINNLNLIKKICNYFDKKYGYENSYFSLVNFVDDRPAHDFRYSLNSKKLFKLLGTKPDNKFDENLYKTIDWYVKNKKWLEKNFKKYKK